LVAFAGIAAGATVLVVVLEVYTLVSAEIGDIVGAFGEALAIDTTLAVLAGDTATSAVFGIGLHIGAGPVTVFSRGGALTQALHAYLVTCTGVVASSTVFGVGFDVRTLCPAKYCVFGTFAGAFDTSGTTFARLCF
jgi:hypothetical protein